MTRGHFASATKQSASVMKELQGSVLKSVGTVRNYEQSLKTCCEHLKNEHLGALRDITKEMAENYLSERALSVSQSTIDRDRLALQCMMQNVTHQLSPNERLKTIKSTKETLLKSRGYTPKQVELITEHQTEKYVFVTQLCYESGLRVHELYTLRPTSEIKPSPREVHENKFSYLAGKTKSYTVNGKGGLIREVQIPIALANQLETYRLKNPITIVDRKVNYQSHYAIPGGLKFSNAFSKNSTRTLGYSHGAHGLRHSYAQNRYQQLSNHYQRNTVMKIISQELGHFREDITAVYLR